MLFSKKISGFSLVEVLIASALISIVAMGTFSLFNIAAKEQKRTNFMISAGIIRSQLFGLIEDSDSWKKIANDSTNSVFSCIRDNVDCNNNEEGPIKVLDQAGSIVFDTSTEGYTWQGTKCLQSAGIENCPIRVTIKSVLLCSSPTCASPSVKTTGTFKNVSTLTPFPFNDANYAFESYRKAGSSMGGYITIITPKDVINEAITRNLFAASPIHSFDPTSVDDPAPTHGSWPSYMSPSPDGPCPTMKDTPKLKINSANQIVGIGGTFNDHIFCTLDITTGSCLIMTYYPWNCTVSPGTVGKRQLSLNVTANGIIVDGIQYPWLK